MMRALIVGTSGSSSPAMMSVGWRSAKPGQTRPARTWRRAAGSNRRGSRSGRGAASAQRARARVETRRRRHPRRRAAHAAVLVSTRRAHPQQRRRLSGNHQRARRRSGEHEPSTARRMLERKLLRDRAAPRHAEHIGFGMSEVIEKACSEARDARTGDTGNGGVGEPPTPGRRKSRPSGASVRR